MIKRPLTSTFLLLCVATVTLAQSDLAKMTADLQKNPSDRALRERIIKLALETKPAPPEPREAIEAAGAAKYYATEAKNEADLFKAAEGYERASAVAPWVAHNYYNAGLMYEKAKQPAKALVNYELYLLASPSAPDTYDVIAKIGAMKAAMKDSEDKKHRQEAAEKQSRADTESFRRGDPNGYWCSTAANLCFAISNGKMTSITNGTIGTSKVDVQSFGVYIDFSYYDLRSNIMHDIHLTIVDYGRRLEGTAQRKVCSNAGSGAKACTWKNLSEAQMSFERR